MSGRPAPSAPPARLLLADRDPALRRVLHLALEAHGYQVTVLEPMVDLTGFDVEATDGHIGKIDEATYDTGASYIVVDSGFWIFGRKRMLPAGVIDRIDIDNRKVFVDLSKDEVKNAPDFDEKRFKEQSYRDDLGDYYGRYGAIGPGRERS
jgi:hypothetical protein